MNCNWPQNLHQSDQSHIVVEVDTDTFNFTSAIVCKREILACWWVEMMVYACKTRAHAKLFSVDTFEFFTPDMFLSVFSAQGISRGEIWKGIGDNCSQSRREPWDLVKNSSLFQNVWITESCMHWAYAYMVNSSEDKTNSWVLECQCRRPSDMKESVRLLWLSNYF